MNTETQFEPTEQEWNEVINSSTEKFGTIILIVNPRHGRYYLEHFINCLPPITFSNTHVLCSEAIYHDENGKGFYQGIFKKNGNWYAVKATRSQFVKLI